MLCLLVEAKKFTLITTNIGRDETEKNVNEQYKIHSALITEYIFYVVISCRRDCPALLPGTTRTIYLITFFFFFKINMNYSYLTDLDFQ